MEDFKARHAPIQAFLFSGAGIDLQNTDGGRTFSPAAKNYGPGIRGGNGVCSGVEGKLMF